MWSSLLPAKGRFASICISLYATLVVSCAHQGSNELVGDPPVLEGVVHTVSKGETLVGIARAYGLTSQRLQRINNIHDPRQLQIGQRLFVPGATERKTAVMVEAAAPREQGVFHLVQGGETLKRISDAYGVEQSAIERSNRIHNPRALQVGQRLFIPGAEEKKTVQMSVAEKVYHKTSGSGEERVELAKRIQGIVDRHRVEKGELPEAKAQPEEDIVAVSTPPATTPTPVPTPTPALAPSNVKPPETVKKVGNIAFSWPLSSQFSMAKKFGVGNGLMRNGVVLSAAPGTPVMAAADGEVMMVGNVNDDFGDTFGNYVVLYHGKQGEKGLRTIYAHNSEIFVKPHEKVERGQMIARVGRTGRTSGSISGDQLHFQVWEAASPVNPLNVLPSLK
ncbi:MAG: LysM peptidoglycan-binding domain-containing M23 family metallopeptidase [bacterium]